MSRKRKIEINFATLLKGYWNPVFLFGPGTERTGPERLGGGHGDGRETGDGRPEGQKKVKVVYPVRENGVPETGTTRL